MKSTLFITIIAVTSTTVMAAHPNFVFMNNTEAIADVDQMCFSFTTTSELPGFYYTFQPPWGTASGYAGSSGSICVPTSDSAGGAMYIDGVGSTPGPGSTKLECYFPTSGTANCDMSLVDGYSLSVGCVPSSTGQVIGGYGNLFGNGIPCPSQSGYQCTNTEGYAPSQSDVDPFFQQALQSGNNYCIWVNCGQDYYFPTGDNIACTVGP